MDPTKESSTRVAFFFQTGRQFSRPSTSSRIDVMERVLTKSLSVTGMSKIVFSLVKLALQWSDLTTRPCMALQNTVLVRVYKEPLYKKVPR